MLKAVKKHFLRLIFIRYLRRQCPEMVPRTGDDARSVNCWSFWVRTVGESYFRIESIQNERLIGHDRSDNNDVSQSSLSIEDVLDAEEWIFRHFYRYADITYGSLGDFIVHRFLGLFYIRAHVYWMKERLATFLFNARPLSETSRKEVLKALVELDLERDDSELHEIDVAVKIYGDRIVIHPSYERIRRLISRQIDSLADEDRLSEISGRLSVKGRAYALLEDMERDDRRHLDSVKMKVWALVLSAIVAISTAVNMFLE